MLTIDLNCDMGEGMANDNELMPYISSANIACGYHAGDEHTILKTVILAIRNNVAIGAHPGFKDKLNFGRKNMNLLPGEIYDLVKAQIFIVDKICRKNNGVLHHVKPHGALYNMAAKDAGLAAAIASAVYDFDKSLILYGLSGSCLVNEAKRLGLPAASEVFADRSYTDDGSLTPRSHPGAMINDMDKAVEQVLQMIQEGSTTSLKGNTVPVVADTLCIHGDGEHAVSFAKEIFTQLHHYQIEINPPAR